MRTQLLATAGIATVALLAAGTAVASPGSPAAHPDLHFNEKIVSISELDLGAKGPSMGDTAAFTLRLFDADGKKVGTGGGTATSVKPKGGDLGLVQLSATYLVGGDQIQILGFYDFTKIKGSVPIVGGSGRFSGVTGQVDFVSPSEGTFVDTFHFED